MFDFNVIVHIKTQFYQDFPESHPTPCHTQKSANILIMDCNTKSI